MIEKDENQRRGLNKLSTEEQSLVAMKETAKLRPERGGWEKSQPLSHNSAKLEMTKVALSPPLSLH